MRLTSGYGPDRPEIYHAAELSLDARRQQHGLGSYEIQKEIVAGALTSVTFLFELAGLEVPTGGKLGVVWRWPVDWGPLQATDPDEPGFVETTIEGCEGELEFEYDPYGGIEPYHHQLLLHVRRGTLGAGGRVRVAVGASGPGWRAPTCALRQVRFLMLLDPKGDSRWTELQAGGDFEVLPGRPDRLVVVAPADAVVGASVPVIVRAEDIWGNPTAFSPLPTPTDTFGFTAAEPRQIDWPAAVHIPVVFERTGVQRLRFEVPGTNLSAESNPIAVHAHKPDRLIIWGDGHSGQSLIGCGAGTLAEYYTFARDAAGLQFLTHQANDHYVTTDDWLETRRVTDELHEPGKFVPILGCEWSPFTKDGGDRNVFYLRDEPRMRRSARFFTESTPDPEPDLPQAPEFLAAFRDLDVLINMHVGGRMTNLDWHEPKIEKLAEIHSTHGTVEWFVFDCLRRGYRVGVTAGTDGVTCRPGADAPGSRLCRNVRNGLTGIHCDELTREALWEALHARRTYGTTGERTRLWFTVNDHAMGEEIEVEDAVRVHAQVEGTAAIERIDLLRGTEVIHTWPIAIRDPDRLRILWSGTARCGNARAQRVVWDGDLKVESGKILAATPLGYCSPLDTLTQESDWQLRWRSLTAGNSAGVVLELEEGKRCRFRSVPTSFDFAPDVVRARDLTMPAGGYDRRVQVGAAPRSDGPRSVRVSFRDVNVPFGDSPYWIRVVQIDQAKAWSSPVYCRRE